jgi:hypothetical protein
MIGVADFNNNYLSQYNEVDNETLKDFLTNKQNDNDDIKAYHRGIPLWLFNASNPRRSTRQLKFTLAERGTGFILWQDRIDAKSQIRLYAMQAKNNEIINYLNYKKENNQHQRAAFSSFLITFKASDRRTTVFIRFDLESEVEEFFNYYIKMESIVVNDSISNMNSINKTKSLPTGMMGLHSQRIFNKSSTLKIHQINALSFETTKKNKRINKNDISSPLTIQHIINIKSSDKSSFYTFNKLLPNEGISVRHQLSSPKNEIIIEIEEDEDNNRTDSALSSSPMSSSLSSPSSTSASQTNSRTNSNSSLELLNKSSFISPLPKSHKVLHSDNVISKKCL